MATPRIMRFAVSSWSLQNNSKYYSMNPTYSFESVIMVDNVLTMFSACVCILQCRFHCQAHI